ncbi:MAG: IS1182 family transposase [Chloroflexi bacterium]|nr:IS1182 family transposase [Chloroflexota bacterium]
MPVRPFSRDQSWLLPPSLDELVPEDHSVRFVAAFVDSLDASAWDELGIRLAGDPLGTAAYHPRLLMAVWLHGFMSGIRSARKLERACLEQLPYMWLANCQRPDHNTLWRFYRDNRKSMRKLLKLTVRTAVKAGLVDLAVQALDGTKVSGNATGDRSYKAEGLEKLMKRVDGAIADLEAQNRTDEERGRCRLPKQLAKMKALREHVEVALAQVMAEEGPSNVNLADPDARLMKSRHGFVAGYNAQAVVSPLREGVAGASGLLITAVGVDNEPSDYARLVPMIEEAKEATITGAEVTLADAGYHSEANLEAVREKGYRVLMPDRQGGKGVGPYHRDRFVYERETDSYTCPEGKKLEFRGVTKRRDGRVIRVYHGSREDCLSCPAFGRCTKNRWHGRKLQVGVYEEVRLKHREVMESTEAKALYKLRKELVEPVFGILKEVQGATRFLLRGLANVQGEWELLATAFNLRTLWRVWRRRRPERSLLLRAAQPS